VYCSALHSALTLTTTPHSKCIEQSCRVRRTDVQRMCVLVIVETLESQRRGSSQILEETLDIISFVKEHCDIRDSSGGLGLDIVKLACF